MKYIPFLCIALLLTACGTEITTNDTDIFDDLPTVSSSSEQFSEASSKAKLETLTGTIEPIGITIYQQGTHKITNDDNSIILLESSAVDLNGYVDEYVTVTGALRATVEADGQIMLVEDIELTEASSESSSEESSVSTEESSSAISNETEASVSSTESSEDSSETSSEAKEVIEVDDPKIEAMLKANLSSEFWTQEYCSRQVPYCFPIHKNWWYTAFGATTNEIMRVDIGPEEIEKVGDGIIMVRLVSGNKASSSTISGNVAYSYASFGEQHFEVSGPAALSEAIAYIAKNITAN